MPQRACIVSGPQHCDADSGVKVLPESGSVERIQLLHLGRQMICVLSTLQCCGAGGFVLALCGLHLQRTCSCHICVPQRDFNANDAALCHWRRCAGDVAACMSRTLAALASQMPVALYGVRAGLL